MSIADLVYLQSLAKKQASDEAYYNYVFQKAYANKIANGWYDTIAQGANQVAAGARGMYDRSLGRVGKAAARGMYGAIRALGGPEAVERFNAGGQSLYDAGRKVALGARGMYDLAKTGGRWARDFWNSPRSATLAARKFGRNVGRAFDTAANRSANTFRKFYNHIQEVEAMNDASNNFKPGVVDMLGRKVTGFKHAFRPTVNEFKNAFWNGYYNRYR